jgi:hypothetical protein
MKKLIVLLFFYIVLLSPFFGISQTIPAEAHQPYKPDNQKLYDTIVYLDSVFFNAYNTCNMELQADFYADDIEFYHDQGGLMTSKQEILDAIRRNICGKVTRELVKGSIEVYPIGTYGAVEMGFHKFHNLAEGTISRGGKFVVIWVNDAGKWKVSRVISLH